MDASGLETAMMQKIAAEMAFSETTFLLPAETDDTDVRMRIFTPKAEIPMAGHPTIGTTFALAHTGQIQNGQKNFVFGLEVGPTSVELKWEADRLQFAWMKQQVPEFGTIATNREDLALALCVEVHDIENSKMPAQEVSSGVPIFFVPLTTRSAVDRVAIDRTALCRYFNKMEIPERIVFVFTLEPADDDATVYNRMFAPMFGIPEDPATGGASGPLGAYLYKYQAVTSAQAKQMISLQGVAMGRPSRIHISIQGKDQKIDEVKVGGEAVLTGEGIIHI